MSRAWSAGSTRAWRKIRILVLIRDGYRCQLRLPGVCTTRASHVHHVLGKAQGDDLTHLVATCAPCNLRTGAPQGDPLPTGGTHW